MSFITGGLGIGGAKGRARKLAGPGQLFFAAPPRMLPGFINTILAGTIDHAVAHGAVADPYAALPSFHAGWFAVAAVVLASGTRRPPVVVLAVVAAAAMALAVVISANHYIIDAASGIGLCFAGVALAAQLRRRRETGRTGDEGSINYGWGPPKRSFHGHPGG
jgi:hypothetical protein